MHNDRIIDLGEDLRNHVFETLDAEPDLTGDDAGKVAKAVEDAFVKALQQVLEPPPANPGSQGGNLVWAVGPKPKITNQDVRCPKCGWTDTSANGHCYNCGAHLDRD